MKLPFMHFLNPSSWTVALSAAALSVLLDPAPAPAQTYTYLQSIGVPRTMGSDNSHFDQPSGIVVDPASGHVFVADPGNDRVQVFDSTSLTYVATIGVTGVPLLTVTTESPGSATSTTGPDNAHLNQPVGVGLDVANQHLLVADTQNGRIQVFDTGSLAYVATIPISSQERPCSVAVRPAIAGAAAKIFVTFCNSTGIVEFDATTFAAVQFEPAGVPDNLPFISGVSYDAATDQLLLSASTHAGFYDPTSIAFIGAVGSSDGGQKMVYDPVSNQILTLEATTGVKLFDALSHKLIGPFPQTNNGPALQLVADVAVDPVHNRLFVADEAGAAVKVYAIAPSLVAAVLPGGRSVETGTAATVFATMINASTGSLSGCSVALPATAPANVSLGYQTTNARTNAATGTANTPATIAAGAAQTFVLQFQATGAATATAMPLDFACTGTAPAAVTPGVDTADLLFSTTPIADVIALSLTPTGDGIAKMLVGGTGFFALATANVGAAAQITATPDFGGATLPLGATICETDPTTGACLAPPAASVTFADATNATPTFSVFLNAAGAIGFAPATNRVFVRFKDASGVSHGSTSVAVMTE